MITPTLFVIGYIAVFALVVLGIKLYFKLGEIRIITKELRRQEDAADFQERAQRQMDRLA